MVRAIADAGRGTEGDLLGGDRGDESLEWIGDERRPKPAQGRNNLREHRLACSEGSEGVEIERLTQIAAHGARQLVAAGCDSNPARLRLDSNLTTVEHAVEPVLVPEVREVRPERPVPLGREREVERLR